MIEDNHYETNVIGRSNFMAFINFFFFLKKTFKRRIQEGSTRPPFKKMKKKME